jgi:hypothetical protein
MSAPRHTSSLASAELRAHLAALERDAVALRDDLARLASACAKAEAAAMNAVQNGDDVSAREELRAHARSLEAAGLVQAELTRVEALLTVCREALAAVANVEDPHK